jgi:hypothetical protein
MSRKDGFQPPPQRTKKSVRFAPTATVHLRSVSDEDLQNSWYDAVSYLRFETENKEVVSFMNDTMKRLCMTTDLSKVSVKTMTNKLIDIFNNDTTDLMRYEILGLEQFLFGPRHMYERRQETVQHAIMVLEMYDVQRTMQQYDFDLLRRVSEKFSYPKVYRAIRRAQTNTE